MIKEDQILIAGIKDKICQCNEQYRMTYSLFFDTRQRNIIESYCKDLKVFHYVLYGGYEDAERNIILFLPDYVLLKENNGIINYFKTNPEDNPLALLHITYEGHRELTHRDYLGSVLSLGIKREKIGDILVREKGCDIITFKDIANFLVLNFEKAANMRLKTELSPIENLVVPEGKRVEIKDTVASLRLDNLVASAFSLSRSKASEAVLKGSIFVNGIQKMKPEFLMKQGDKLVFRGKGKSILKEIGKETKKDRIFIILERYL
ncbi:RNA-binding protein [Sinanaerobacter sp. ZZT-01]|uniref:YlmH family RNA-binding protein n=1 Tax=Sinanaerobacter sp. ZZT-01 TaxID=3111540 RepID=UPI002D7985FD|nr:YlmH/Sll1252 family protein [Sinanaerobacter sp. ZZT-01]WRR93050.1 YlmH/Sll1252 family protein [Sinanaerobacter sp. ZZT-01]